jgi:hypothetical protein
MANAAAMAALTAVAAGAAACDSSRNPTAPSTIGADGVSEVKPTSVASAARSTNADAAMQSEEVRADTEVPSVAKWLSRPDWSNPFPCCVNQGGFILSTPTPTVVMVISNGFSQATNGGTIAVRLTGGSAAVQFGFSVLRSNVNLSTCSHVWAVDGAVVSHAPNGLCRFTRAGTHNISVKVTNALNFTTVTSATVVVSSN